MPTDQLARTMKTFDSLGVDYTGRGTRPGDGTATGTATQPTFAKPTDGRDRTASNGQICGGETESSFTIRSADGSIETASQSIVIQYPAAGRR